jgi:putative acetyltransferase
MREAYRSARVVLCSRPCSGTAVAMAFPERRLRDGVHPIDAAEGPRLLEVWEAAVRATHDFLSEADIASLRPLVVPALFGLPALAGARDAVGTLIGFVGVDGEKMEALFVHPAWHGAGVGRRLAEHAMSALRVTSVDVNEQNPRAVAFYRHLGFEVVGRSDRDGAGRPFPLLHMRLEPAGPASPGRDPGAA